MKRAYGTNKASKVSPQAGISDMPENVITHILECLPIKEAVRTGILSRNWRFKWTNISQLVFDAKFFEPGLDGRNNCSERTISRLLLHLKGVVTKFVLFIPSHKILDVEEVCHWVLFLSCKGISEFTVINTNPKLLKLPTHLFTCLELTVLKLRNCCFHVPPDFCGFPNLLNLDFTRVEIMGRNIGEFISWCPLLEILKISYNQPSGKGKRVELVGFLPKLQELCLDFQNCKLADGSKLVPTVFPCLKTLELFEIDFGCSAMLSCAFGMIWGSPNLQSLYVIATYKDVVQLPSLKCLEVHYTKMRMLQLQSVVFSFFKGSETEVCLIKCILACSPSLKRITIIPDPFHVFGGEKGMLMFASKLLELHRASTIAEVEMDWLEI